MSSNIEGYNYDIFISYRQKDNKGDRWVSEFVEALKTELESTFKEEISVYFDINPHDGLLETHDVDASLKDKLKCLVFIPIISRTYCDPKSFAWEHEFKAFVEEATKDKFGLKVKLPNGNVANRVLPVLIHDLDNDDIKLCESVLNGVLRGVEFIYKESGVNKSLTIEDDEKKNLNHTKYRIQLNKVANAIKEVITSMGQYEQKPIEVSREVFKTVSVPRKSYKTKIIAGLIITLAVIVFGFLFVPKLIKPSEQLEKSIAVLPFRNESPSDSTTYFINGLMEEILNNLQKIGAFSKVHSRTSTEQYRGITRPPIPKIAKDLDVNFIVEGSGQKYGNFYQIRVQLIEGKADKHLWGDSYETEIRDTKDIYRIQSQIAQAIASELKAVITPDEKQLIDKIQTTILTAYDFYQRGREELTIYEVDNRNKAALQKAEDSFHKALKYDSTYAQAYTGLASVYWSKHYWNEYFSENFMDSILIFTNKALSIDDQLSDAFILRGNYYYSKGLMDKAVKEYDIALKYNPNDYQAYVQKAYISLALKDYVATFDNAYKAINRYHGGMLPMHLGALAQLYSDVGFIDKAKYYYNEAYKLDGDSATYFRNIEGLEWSNENFDAAIIWRKKSFEIDSMPDYDNLVWLNIEGQHKEAYLLAVNLVNQVKNSGAPLLYHSHRIGYAFWKVGKLKEADYYFKEQIKYCKGSIKLGREYASSKDAQYNLAATYAFLGEKEKAYQNLSEFSKLNFFPKWWITLIKYDPLFDNLKSEEQFKKIIQNMEAKYQVEHERVRKWLEEHGKL